MKRLFINISFLSLALVGFTLTGCDDDLTTSSVTYTRLTLPTNREV